LSDHDAYKDEMGRFFRMSDRDLDRLMAGKAPEGDEELAELAAFLREVEAAHLKFPPESTEARQLAAILEAAQLLSDKGEPVARPASKAPGPDVSGIPDLQASPLPSWRRNLMPTGLLSNVWSKAAVAAVAALLVCCGLAAAGALPDSLQTAAANAAGQVGVSLDNPGDTDEVGDVDGVDDNDAQGDDDGAKKDDDAQGNESDDGDNGNNGNNGDSQPVKASEDTSTPAPAVTAPPAPADDDNDAEDKDDDHANSAPAAKDDDDNEADDDNKTEDDDNDADEDDHESADDEGAAHEPDHESGDEGESDD
jgi:hypothetical protein